MRLVSSQGEAVRGRCRSTNRCSYCARLGAVENAELLALDAIASGSAPGVWAVLTTRSTDPDPASFYASRKAVMKALRRRWPDCEYAALVEFTTGYGERARGGRRPHWNLLLKGVPVDALDQVGDVIRSVWCAREDAEPWAQFVGQVAEVGGLLRYIALHFQKESQKPPEGWAGHRFLKSRGYLSTATSEARAAARESLAFKREIWRAIRRGLVGDQVEEAVAEAMALREATTWQMVDVTRSVTASTRGRESTRPSGRQGGPESLPCPANSSAAAPPRARDVGAGPRADGALPEEDGQTAPQARTGGIGGVSPLLHLSPANSVVDDP